MPPAALLPLAALFIPTAAQCGAVLAPLAALVALRFLLGGIDAIIHRLFPSLEWERQLGWLNIRAERRAAAVLRWLGYAVYAVLGAALYGLAWGAVGLRSVWQWSDPTVMGHLVDRLPVLFTCLGLWLLYLGGSLLPRLRRDYEREEHEAFRAEWDAIGARAEGGPAPRLRTGQRSPMPTRPRARR